MYSLFLALNWEKKIMNEICRRFKIWATRLIVRHILYSGKPLHVHVCLYIHVETWFLSPSRLLKTLVQVLLSGFLSISRKVFLSYNFGVEYIQIYTSEMQRYIYSNNTQITPPIYSRREIDQYGRYTN